MVLSKLNWLSRSPEFPRRPANRTIGGMREPRLGIDIGRVIIAGGAQANDAPQDDTDPDAADTAFFDGDEAAMLATPEVDGAIDTIAALVPLFGGRVWLVSKCGERVEARTLRWLDAHDFYARTGMARDHVRFCRRRADKRIHCAELNLTHFVDDRPDVHAAIRDVVSELYFFGPQPDPVPAYGHHTSTWTDVARLIVASLAP